MADAETVADDELRSSLASKLDVAVTGTELLHDGLNLVVAVSSETDDPAYVLRCPRKLRDAEYMNDLRTEYRVLKRLEPTPVETPDPVAFCDDESLLGDPFFVMTALDGEPVPLGADLPERFRDANSRRRVAELLVDSLAEVHAVDADRFAGVCDRATPREQVAEAIDRLDAARSVTGHDRPRLRSVGERLLDDAPSETETTLVHGDFRPGNVLLSGTDRPEMTGVLDWESAMLGDPLTELGYLLLRWRDDGDPTPSLDDLESKYPASDALDYLREVNENGLAPFTARAGSPTRRELVARYERRTGREFDHRRFYLAQSAFLLGTVWSDLHRHEVEAGGDPDRDPNVEYVAMLAERILDGGFEL